MTDQQAMFWCVVPAAGRGERFGGTLPKQYQSLRGKPLLHWTLERLAAHPRIAGLCVVVAADDVHWSAPDALLGKPLRSAIGGAKRADSVLAGLSSLPDDVGPEDFVLVHDAARPCISAVDISRLIDVAGAGGGGLLAAPLHDTLKRSHADGRVAATEARESRWRALTPQLFRRGELAAALMDAARAAVSVSDESMAMERVGHRPLLVEGSAANVKVTTRAELAFVEYLLGNGQANDLAADQGHS